ncbi:BtrH N-terminal domain-containing protein [Streptomyces phaeoluteigriseus]|uniref:BtrH N-terminal domain-containing protein n=1 Tax=Streptomyces phaeoluteigriseus TaxID=114686 RepID=UPI0009A1AC9B|nr:BtrH N-terminal domain-containing protein [Streptomyces phaeoluteigriseus]
MDSEGAEFVEQQGSPDPEFSALDCISATFGITALWLGRDPSVLGDHWGYHRRTDAVDCEWPVEHLGIHRRTPEEILHEWYGLTADHVQHADTEQAEEYIRAQLRDGNPVIAWVDTFHVPHSSFHLQQHHSHRIVIRPEDGDDKEDTGPFRIVDRYQGSLFDGSMERGTLFTAMSSDALGEARRGDPDWRNRTVVVKAGTPDSGEVRAAVRREAQGERFRAAVASTARSFAGADLVTACADELRAAPDDFTSLGPVGTIEVSAWFGELASQRALNARFLRAAAETCAIPSLHDRAADAEALSRRWEMTRNYFFLRFRKGAVAVRRIADLITETATMEREWNEKLRTSVGGSDPHADEPLPNVPDLLVPPGAAS